jgi:hypothetical protein
MYRSRFLVLSFVALAMVLSGCSKSKQMGSLSVYTRARSDAKGPWANTVLVVNGYGFAPHKRIDLTFKGLPVEAPRSNSWHTDQPIAAMTDANGSFSWSITVKSASTAVASWSRYIAALPPLDYYADPNTEVTVIAKEHWRPYYAQATIKAGELIAAPYNGGVAAADTSKAPAAAAK